MNARPRAWVGFIASALVHLFSFALYRRMPDVRATTADAAAALLRTTSVGLSPTDVWWISHLWQSTMFAIVIAGIAFLCRHKRAGVRFGLWLTASVKFLLPFGWLFALGRSVPGPVVYSSRVVAAEAVWTVWSSTGIPIAHVSSAASAAAVDRWQTLLLLVWVSGCLCVLRVRAREWRQARRLLAASEPCVLPALAAPQCLPVRASAALLEPAVIGVWRPTLVLPIAISRQLSVAQLQAVIAHEAAHVRRRDNLTAFFHMAVETLVWFHPVVWWIGRRLVEERERACDEAVLEEAGDPQTYAQAIVSVCRHHVEARLAWAAGVGGADLKQRLLAILNRQIGQALTPAQRRLIAVSAIVTLTTPFGAGFVGRPPVYVLVAAAQGATFETASIKPSDSSRPGWDIVPQPGRVVATNASVLALVRFAYELPEFEVSGGPSWLSSDRFDVIATTPGNPPVAQKRAMLQQLLRDRFKLVAHTEERELPIYALTMARQDRRLGPKLTPSTQNCGGSDQPSVDSGIGPGDWRTRPLSCGFFGIGPGANFPEGRVALALRGITMAALAKTLVPVVHRAVIDETGLTGYFDADFDPIAEIPPPPPPPGVPNPFTAPFVSIFTVFPEQLGLKLESKRGPVRVLILDSAERPTPN